MANPKQSTALTILNHLTLQKTSNAEHVVMKRSDIKTVLAFYKDIDAKLETAKEVIKNHTCIGRFGHPQELLDHVEKNMQEALQSISHESDE